jgi:hypothetical protein
MADDISIRCVSGVRKFDCLDCSALSFYIYSVLYIFYTQRTGNQPLQERQILRSSRGTMRNAKRRWSSLDRRVDRVAVADAVDLSLSL